MPVTPEQVRRRGQRREFKDAIERIDEGLLEGSNSFATSLFSLTVMDLRELMDLYEKSGWKVEYVTDWRDGDYLAFKEK